MRTVPLRRLVASVDNGAWGVDPNETASDTTALCIRAADFAFSELRVDTSRAPTRGFNTRTLERLQLSPGDIVLEKSGGGEKLPVGRSVLFDHEGPAVPTNFAARLRPTQNVNSKYLVYVLRHLYESGATARCIKQTTGIQNLDTDAWLMTDAPRPSEQEQRRIADFLDERVSRIDRIIAARREQMVQAREGYESMRRSLVLGTHSPDVHSTDLPWAQSVGSDRIVRRLAQMATMGTGHTPNRSNADYWVDCTIPWLTTSDVHRFRRDEIDEINDPEILISDLGLANSAAVLHPAGTVALSRTASAGFSIVMGTGMATSQDFVTWTCGPDLEPHFLLASLRVMRPFLLGNLATGSTHKTIYFPDLMDLRLPVPPVTTQREAIDKIQAAAAAYWSGNNAMQGQVDLLTEYKSSLITASVTGELDVSTAGSNIPG